MTNPDPRGRHPNSVHALATYRTFLNDRPKCTVMARGTGQTCRRVAVKGCRACVLHGGWRFRSRPLSPWRIRYQALQQAMRSGLVPDDLAQQEPWRRAAGHTRRNVEPMLGMMAAWSARDAAAWSQAVQGIAP